MQHPDNQTITDYISGSLAEGDADLCENHFAKCDACRHELTLLVRVLDENVLPDEAAILERVESNRRHSNPSRSTRSAWKLAAAAIAAIMILTAAWALFSGRPSEPNAGDSTVERIFEARIAGDPYAPFTHTRAGSQSDTPESTSDELSRLSTNDLEIGRYYLRHRDFEKAIRHLDDAAKKAPRSAEIPNDLGVAYLESGSEETLQKAANAFLKALDLDSRYAPALFNLSIAYERMGNFSEAARQLDRYLAVDPDSGWAKEAQTKLQLLRR